MVTPIARLPVVAAPTPRLVSPFMRGEPTLEKVARGELKLPFSAGNTSTDAVLKLKSTLAALGLAVPTDGAFLDDEAAAMKAVSKAVSDLQRFAKLPQTGTLDAATLRAADTLLMTGKVIAAPAPGKPAWTAPPATPADASYFTDADQLTVPNEFRKFVDQALKSKRTEDIVGLRTEDLMLATPGEKAAMFAMLAKNGAGTREQQFMLQELQRKPAEGAKVLDALWATGKLNQVLNAFGGATAARLHAQLPSMIGNAKTAAGAVTALSKEDSRENRLAAHHVFDRARAGGFLDDTLSQLKGPAKTARAGGFLDDTLSQLKGPAKTNAVVRDLVSQARPTIRPEVIAHRAGDPINFPENTIAAMEAGLDQGMEAMEIDITVTKDNQIILWHDFEPDGLVAQLREGGMEGSAGPEGQGYKPVKPPMGHPARKPMYDLNLESIRANYGYAKRDGNLLTSDKRDVKNPIPTFKEVVKWVKAHPELKRLVLDIKLPPGKPEVQQRFARELRAQLEAAGLEEKVLLMSNDAGTLEQVKKLVPGVSATLDVEIVSLAPDADDYSAVGTAARMGNDVASVGKPVLGIGGYSTYLEVLEKDRARIKASGKPTELIAWTINDELEMREVIAKGVDGILTDQPARLREVLRAYGWK